jgi:hypothetical protein
VGGRLRILLLIVVATAACDTFHGLESRSELGKAADIDCIDRVLRASPDIEDVSFARATTRSFAVVPRWESQLAVNNYWAYRAAGRAMVLQVVEEDGHTFYSNGLVRVETRVAPDLAASLSPLIVRLDQALVAECGLAAAAPLSVLHF